jgi:hypothetical protein
MHQTKFEMISHAEKPPATENDTIFTRSITFGVQKVERDVKRKKLITVPFRSRQ